LKPFEFKRIRRELGLSQSQLADLLGVASGRTVRKWEAGENDIAAPAALLMTLLDQGVLTVEKIRKATEQ
tara:strand:- start:85 stop:294 length:210 start_codon:yes stop_codon:yes gene_type:complete